MQELRASLAEEHVARRDLARLLAEERQQNSDQEDAHAECQLIINNHMARLQGALQGAVELMRDDVYPCLDAQSAMLQRHETRLDNADVFWVTLQHGPGNPIEVAVSRTRMDPGYFGRKPQHLRYFKTRKETRNRGRLGGEEQDNERR